MLTDFLNELRRLKFLGVSRGMLSWEFCFDFNSLKSPFLGFWIIQTGYWQVPFSSGDWPCNLERFFFIKNVSVLWKIGPISVKRWKPVWIRAWNEYHSASRASFWAVQWEGKKEALWWLNPNFYTGQSCFLSSNCFFFFRVPASVHWWSVCHNWARCRKRTAIRSGSILVPRARRFLVTWSYNLRRVALGTRMV